MLLPRMPHLRRAHLRTFALLRVLMHRFRRLSIYLTVAHPPTHPMAHLTWESASRPAHMLWYSLLLLPLFRLQRLCSPPKRLSQLPRLCPRRHHRAMRLRMHLSRHTRTGHLIRRLPRITSRRHRGLILCRRYRTHSPRVL